MVDALLHLLLINKSNFYAFSKTVDSIVAMMYIDDANNHIVFVDMTAKYRR